MSPEERRAFIASNEDLHASCTLDPYFNERFRMPLPRPEDREYAHVHPYKGNLVATYTNTEPLFHVGEVPVYCVYYALDDMGDPLLPVDTCFFSPILAMAAIDNYLALEPKARHAYWRMEFTGPWKLMHQNYRMQPSLPAIAETLRQVDIEAADPDIDIFFSDASEFAAHIRATLKPLFAQLSCGSPIKPTDYEGELQ